MHAVDRLLTNQIEAPIQMAENEVTYVLVGDKPWLWWPFENQPFIRCVYRYYDANDRLLYIGSTGNPQKRFLDHGNNVSWRWEIRYAVIVGYDNESEAYDAERAAIRHEMPRYNIHHTRRWLAGEEWLHRYDPLDRRRYPGILTARSSEPIDDLLDELPDA